MNSLHKKHPRRKFLNWFLGTSAGALFGSIIYPVIRYMSPPRLPESTTSQVDAGRTNDSEFLEKGYKIVRFGAEPVIVVRVDEAEFRAFSATCTHLDCIVEYQKDHSRIWCNCHNGHYDLSGRNVAGPPPKPLTLYEVNLVQESPKDPSRILVSKV